MDWDITREKASEIADAVKKIVSKDVSVYNAVRLMDKKDMIQIPSSPPTELLHIDNATRIQNKMDSTTTSVCDSSGQNNRLVSDNVNTARDVPEDNYGANKTVPEITSLSIDSNKKVNINGTVAIKELNRATPCNIDTTRSFLTTSDDEPKQNFSKTVSILMDSSTSKNDKKVTLTDTKTINVTADAETKVKSKIDNETLKSNNLKKNFQDEPVGNIKASNDGVVDKAEIKEEKESPFKVVGGYSSSNIIKKYSSHLGVITSLLVIVAIYLRLT